MYSKFGFLTYQISHVIRQRFNREMENMGLTHAQWRALVYLSENENCRQVDLADILEVKPITLARQVDLLEEAGLVCRKKDREDRRAYRLELTAKAKSIMQELWNVADSIENQLLEVLSDDEQTHLLKLLERVKAHITESFPGHSH